MWTSGTDDPVRLRQTKNSQRVVATQMLVKKFVLVGDKMSQLRQLFRNRRLVIVAGTTEVGKRRRTFNITFSFFFIFFFNVNSSSAVLNN